MSRAIALPSETRLAYGLIPVASLMEQRGADPAAALAAAGVPAFALTDPTYPITIEQEVAFMRVARRALPERHASLVIAERYDLRVFSVLGLAMQSCATLGDALGLLGRFPRLAWGIARLELVTLRGTVRLRFLPHGSLGELAGFLHERDLASFLLLCRELVGAPVTYANVRLATDRPADARPFRDLFGCPVQFGAELTECVIDASWPQTPLPSPNARMRAFYEAQCAAMSDSLDQPFSFSRSLVARLRWADRPLSLEDVADELGMTPRSVQRRLAVEKVAFSRLLCGVRQARAERLLTQTRLGLAEVARQCGYADETAFSRAFRRWRGMAPSKWRRSVRHADVAA